MRKLLFALVFVPFFAVTASADFVGGGAGFAIPDNNSIGASSSIAVNLGPNEIISDVSVVLLGFDHTFIGNINATLTGPGGSVDLMIRTGRLGAGAGDSSNVNGFYVFADTGANWWNAAVAAGGTNGVITQGVYAPTTTNGAAQSFAGTFGGTMTNGLWTLTISDNAILDTGSVGSWNLSIRSAVPEPSSLGLAGLAVVGLIMVRRRRA